MDLRGRKILIIAAGVWQIPVIKKAKDMGLTVISTDRDPGAPGFAFADFHETVDITDLAGTLAVAKKYVVDAVITDQTDVAVPTAAYISEKLGLPGIWYETALRATNKFLMREACRKAGVPMPAYRKVRTTDEAAGAAEEIGYPVVIKPVDSQSSRGVAKVFNPSDMYMWFPRAIENTREQSVLIEEMMTGVESSLEGFVIDGKLTVLGICDKVKCPPPFSYDLRLVYPAFFEQKIIDEMKAMNQTIVAAIGISSGITHTEMIVTPEGPRLLEIAARGCGSRVASDLIPAMTGVDLTGLKIAQLFGSHISVKRTLYKCGILEFIMLPEGIVKKITGMQEAVKIPGVLAAELFVRKGDTIGIIDSGRKRPGYVLAIGDSRDEVVEKVESVKKMLCIEMEKAA
jgi:biotin carboxylase